MCEFNSKITIVQLLRLAILSAKSRIYSPRRGYLSPGNSIVLEIETLYYSSASQILADFGAHLLKFKHVFRVSPSYFPVRLLNDMRV